ncbi:MAG: threonine synthase [Archaeoglobaceae archaeon]
MDYTLRCIECGREYETDDLYKCECGGLLEAAIDLDSVEVDFKLDGRDLGVWKYRSLIPVKIDPVSLGEGGTTLYHATRIEEETGIGSVFVKHEGLNPSGSFKDRGMTVGVTKAIELGKDAVSCASTGNTSASMAMYGAKAGLRAYVLLPAGKVALGKVAQALMHGAKIIGIKGNFDEALNIVKEVSRVQNFYLLNSMNPFRLEGQKTIAYEIVDKIGVPDRLILPVGNAGNISAIYKGFLELKKLGLTEKIPRMTGIQSSGANPVFSAVRIHGEWVEPVMEPETVATAIRIGNPVNARKALRAIYGSDGTSIEVNDEEILDAQRTLASREGIGVEPASAASIAGLRKLAPEIGQDETVACVTTGHLLKDPEIVMKVCGQPIEVEASVEAVTREL